MHSIVSLMTSLRASSPHLGSVCSQVSICLHCIYVAALHNVTDSVAHSCMHVCLCRSCVLLWAPATVDLVDLSRRRSVLEDQVPIPSSLPRPVQPHQVHPHCLHPHFLVPSPPPNIGYYCQQPGRASIRYCGVHNDAVSTSPLHKHRFQCHILCSGPASYFHNGYRAGSAYYHALGHTQGM